MTSSSILTVIFLAAAAVHAQSLDDRIMLPPVTGTDQTELIDTDTPSAPSAATETDTGAAEKISLEDVVIYGNTTFITTPGNKPPAAAEGILIPRDAPHSHQRDNLYRFLPHVENKFLLSRDWTLRDKFLSKFSLSYGAWNTLDGNLILGRQNFLLRTDQLVDLFFNVLLRQSLGHEDNGDYFSRATGLKGTCLYEIERNVETKTYVDYRNGTYHQPNRLATRTTGRTEMGLLMNAYKGDYATANVHLAYTAGSLEDTARVSEHSSLLKVRGSLKRYGLLLKGEGSYTGYSIIPPGSASPSDTSNDIEKNKTDLFCLTVHEDGWRVPLEGHELIINGGLTLWTFSNYLYGKRLRTTLHPSFSAQYALFRDTDVFLRFSPEMLLTPLDKLVETNRYIKKDIQTAPQDRYIDIVTGGEYRYPGGITISTAFGYERTRRRLRYQFDPADSLYYVSTATGSAYPDADVQTGKFSLGIRTREWHRTLLEAFWDYRNESFISNDVPVPYAPRYKIGAAVAGSWFYGIEQRWYVYRTAERYWGTGANDALPAYTMLDISLAKTIMEELKVYATAAVSLDGNYRTWYGYTAPLAQLAAGLRLRW